ncbi:MAG TPA: helix-turn-helix domain-containing protein, partial [Polyangiaceae bacterium]
LFYRLNVVSIAIPALRERPEDIPALVQFFLAKHGGERKPKITRAALDRLVAFAWPGNVRQLENEIRRAVVLAPDDRIDEGELSEDIARGGPGAARAAGHDLRSRVDALETDLLRDALEKTGGNQTKAAQLLGLSRFGLQKMMKRLAVSSR